MLPRGLLLTILALLCISPPEGFAFTYTWTGNGGSNGWSLAANWTSSDGGAATPGAAAGDTAIIPNGLNEPVSVDVTPAAVVDALNVTGSAASVSIDNPITVINVTMNGSGASIRGGKALTIQDSLSVTAGTWPQNNNLVFTGAAAGTHTISTTATIAATAQINAPGQIYTWISPAAAISKQLSVMAGELDVNVPLTITQNSNISAGAVMTLNADISVSGGMTVNGTLNANSAYITVKNNWTTNATGTLNAGTSTVEFIGGNSNLNPNGNNATHAFYNVTVNQPGATLTLQNVLRINNDLLITATSIFASGNFQINVGGDWTKNGSFTVGTGTVVFDGAGAQVFTEATPTTFNIVNIAKTAGSLTMTTAFNTATLNVTAPGAAYDIAINAGGTVSGPATTFQNTGTLAITAGYTFTNGAVATAPMGKTLGGIIASTASALNFGTTPTTLSGNTTLNSTNGTITLATVNATTSGAQSLALNAGSGAAVLNGPMGLATALSTLTASAGAGITIRSVTTTSNQVYNNAVTLGANAVWTGTSGTFASTINGAGYDLTESYSLTETIAGPNLFGVRNLVLDNGGTTNLSGTLTTTGTQRFDDTLVLTADTTLNSGNSSITFNGTVNAQTAGGQALTVNAGTASTALNAGMGLSFKLSSLSVTANAGITINAGITTSGAQTFNGPVTLGATVALTANTGSLIWFASTLNGAFGLTVASADARFNGLVGTFFPLASLSVGGSATINASTLTTTGSQTYSGPVTLGATTTLSTTNSSLLFASTLDGAVANSQGLTVNSGSGAVTFSGVVGTVPLAFLTVNSTSLITLQSVSTSTSVGGSQSYGTSLLLETDTVLTGYSGSFTGSITGGGFSLTLSFASTVLITSASFTGISNFTANGPIQLSGSITTTGTQSYNAVVQLIGGVILTTTDSTVSFASTVDGDVAGRQLTVAAGSASATFGSSVGATNALGAISLTANTISFLGGASSVHGTSSILLRPATAAIPVGIVGGAGTLAIGSSTIAALAAGFTQVQIGQASGTNAVTLGAAGATFTSPVLLQSNGVGGSVVLQGSLAAGANAVSITASTITLSSAGTVVSTSGANISFNGPVFLTVNTAIASAGGNILFASTLDSVSTTPFTLALAKAGGTLTFSSATGAAHALASLSVDAAGSTLINAGITTTGAQTFNGPVTLGATVALTANPGSLVRFASTLNGAFGLTVTSADARFDGLVGASFPLAFLSVGGSTLINAGITTTGAQTFNGPVTLGATVALTANPGSLVRFASTLNGAFGLTVTSADARFDGLVGASFSLASLSVGGSTTINASALTTTGAQAFNGPVTLGVSATLGTAGGSITLTSTIAGAGNDLALVSHGGTTNVAGAVSGVGVLTLQDGTAGSTGAEVFGASVAVTSLATFARPYSVALNGGGSIPNPVTFLNTGTVTIGNGFDFAGGVTASGPSGMSIAGTISAEGTGVINLNVPVTVTANALLGGLSTGAITVGTASIAAGSTLTLGAAAATPISTASVAGLSASANLTINTLGAVSVGGAVGPNMGVVAVTRSGGVSFAAAAAAGTFTLSATTAGQTVSFGGPLTATTVTTGASGYNVALNGGGSVANAVTFNNTGALSIGPAGFTFSAGVTATAPAVVNLAGTIAAGGTGVLNFAAAAVNVTANATVGGSSTGTITLGPVVMANSATLTLGAGAATPVVTGSISGPGAPPAANLSVNTLAAVSVGGTIGTNIGTVTVVAGTMDVQANDFSIATLSNNGTFRLTGAQATQSIGTMTMSGIVQYRGSGGTVGLAVFNSLSIAGTGTFTLAQPIQVGPVPPLVGTGRLWITSGTLDVSSSNFAITINGDWSNSVGAAGFNARAGTVSFVKPGPGPIFISGSTTWFVFHASVPNTTMQFQAGATQKIANSAGATFDVNPSSGNINIISQTPGSYWLIDMGSAATISVPVSGTVTVDWSSATPYDVVPPTGYVLTSPPPTHCPGWKNVNLVNASSTGDANANGKIDRILVTTQYSLRKAPDSFAGLQVQVTGYVLDASAGSASGSPYNWTDPSLAANQFWIMLKEQAQTDTGAAPTWTVVSNASLDDSGSGIYYVATGTYGATDAARPVVGYTLALIGQAQVFLHFSEPVSSGGGGALQTTDVTFSTGALPALSVTVITVITTSEVLLTVNRTITADDVLLPAMMHVAGTAKDGAASPNLILIPAAGHRISDLGLGPPGDGLMEAVYARDETYGSNPGQDIVSLGSFDGTVNLLDRADITVEGHIHTLTTEPLPAAGTTSLWYDADVSAGLRTASGLWLPPFNDDTTAAGGFSGLVPTNGGGDAAAASRSEASASSQLRDFVVPKTDPKLQSPVLVDFLFQVPTAAGPALYAARAQNPSASDWYRHIAPWSFRLREPSPQRAAVTILDNVVRPANGDQARLRYTLSSAGPVRVLVFDFAGNVVSILASAQSQDAGNYEVLWGGQNTGGRMVARGIYFIRIIAPGLDEIRKVLVVR